MVNTLLNLYATTKGKMLLNGKEVSPSSIHLSNNLIAPVFYDFFLFDEFYGVEGLDENKLNFFLKLFELENKVCLTEKRELSTIDLSAGQRKRLALIIAL